MRNVALEKQERYEVGIFPIPGVVAFPYQKLELHVYEERYKRLVEDGVRKGREIAIALAKAPVGEILGEDANYVEVLSQSNTLFKPHEILSSGPFVLKERLPDGRYLIEIDIVRRVAIESITQDIPYPVAQVSTKDDLPTDDLKRVDLFSNLTELCQLLLGANYEAFVRQLPLHVFFNHNLSRYTFEVFKWCRLEPEQMQRALEMRDPCERAELLISVITKYLQLTGQQVPEFEDRSVPEGEADVVRVNFKNKKQAEYTVER